MRTFVKSLIAVTFLCLFSVSASAQDCTDPGSILSVRNSSQGRFEYVTFRLKRPLQSGYARSVATVHPPFTEDPSGNPVTVAGSKFKEITFRGIFWTCSIREFLSLPKPAIKGIKKTAQFEGVVTYVIGYRSYSRYVSTYNVNSGSIRKVIMKFRK